MTIFPKQLGVLRQNAFILPLLFFLVQIAFDCRAEDTKKVYPYWTLECSDHLYKGFIHFSPTECRELKQFMPATISVENPTVRIENGDSGSRIFMQLSPKWKPVDCPCHSQLSSSATEPKQIEIAPVGWDSRQSPVIPAAPSVSTPISDASTNTTGDTVGKILVASVEPSIVGRIFRFLTTPEMLTLTIAGTLSLWIYDVIKKWFRLVRRNFS